MFFERYPDIPVYATPVTVEPTRVLHADARKIMQMRLEEEGELPLYTEQIQPILSASQRNALIWESGPAIIVSSSGMLAGRPSATYARALAGKAENAILLIGYQDEEAPGRCLQEMAWRGHGKLHLGDKKVDVHCQPATLAASSTGQALEINAAYAVIRQALANSGLYLTGLKEGKIVLTFISPQVGERHRTQIDELEAQVGWPLRIHPQPNQNANLDATLRLLQQQGWLVAKGPSIYVDRGEVGVSLEELSDEKGC